MRGKLASRGKAKRADYILYFKPNIPLALIEAKDSNHSVGDGLQQGLEYAETLGVPFVFSSNGDGFRLARSHRRMQRHRDNARPRGIPSPADLWELYRAWKGLTASAERMVLQDYFDRDLNGYRNTMSWLVILSSRV